MTLFPKKKSKLDLLIEKYEQKERGAHTMKHWIFKSFVRELKELRDGKDRNEM
jgi:hypothetical protein